MKKLFILGLAALLTLAAGCGERALILTVRRPSRVFPRREI